MPVRVRYGSGKPHVHYAHPVDTRKIKGLHRKAVFVARELGLFFLDLVRNEKHQEKYPEGSPEEYARR